VFCTIQYQMLFYCQGMLRNEVTGVNSITCCAPSLADDITCISTTPRGLPRMFDIYTEYAKHPLVGILCVNIKHSLVCIFCVNIKHPLVGILCVNIKYLHRVCQHVDVWYLHRVCQQVDVWYLHRVCQQVDVSVQWTEILCGSRLVGILCVNIKHPLVGILCVNIKHPLVGILCVNIKHPRVGILY
jgi:hypothetical protein